MLNIFIGSHGTGKSLLLKVLKNEDDREMFTWLANSLIKRNK